MVRCLLWAISDPAPVPSAGAGFFLPLLHFARLFLTHHDGTLRSLDGPAGSASWPRATPTGWSGRSNGGPTGCTQSAFRTARPRQRQCTRLRGRLRAARHCRFRPLLLLSTPHDYQLKDGRLTFTSPVPSGYPENNTVHALLVPGAEGPGAGAGGAAAVEFRRGRPRGTGEAAQPVRHQRLRMTMAYHAERKPAELQRADYHVSSNVGRTIHACRQSVIDARACLDWLAAQGYERIGILGTSLGSCMAFIAAAHDRAGQSGDLQSRLDVFLGRGLDGPFDAERAPGLRRTCQPGGIAAILERDQPGQLTWSACRAAI